MAAIAFDNSYARLPEAFFARVRPAEVPQPGLIKVNRALARDLGLDPDWLASAEGVAMLAGNTLPETAEPIAMAYAGHQFGGWSPQLGDGRAILIGEVVAADGVRRDVQLKGSGRTPFSRQGDGKAPLGPVIREYLVSEAMAALGVPTTRALAAVTTGEVVERETRQPGGVLTRVAQSHVRVGTFQYFYARDEQVLLKQLADYVIARHYPDAQQAENPYRGLLEGVIARQAELIAQWLQIGFIHGVMNTDNMQIAGETIDFGPCAFMEDFDAATVLSSIDRHGRYAWGNQASIGQWNLSRLAEALLPLLGPDENTAVAEATAALDAYGPRFEALFTQGFRRKLGLAPVADGKETEADAFLDETFTTLSQQRVDFTLFFRRLTQVANGSDAQPLLALFAEASAGEQWLAGWRAVSGFAAGTAGDAERAAAMQRVNPIYIPRNHRVEQAIQGALRGDYADFERLNAVLARPFDEQPDAAAYEQPAAPDEVVQRTFCGT
jgi:uncharacterized protein YdiU (UPF0061 family)